MRYHRFAVLIALAPMVVGATACITHTAPEPSVSSLVVHNRSFFDVNVYSVTSTVAPAVRLGTVTGGAIVTFPLRRANVQPGGVLVVMVHAIGSRGSWTSSAVTLGDGIVAVLDVSTDPFGDCSTSSLYTMPVRDVPQVPAPAVGAGARCIA